jgi:hypothetical protein
MPRKTPILLLFSLFALLLVFSGCAQSATETTPAPATDITAQQEQTQYIYDLFQGAETSAEDQPEIILAIKDIDWGEYERISQGKSIELIEWLYMLDISDEAQISSLMQGTTGLDGAYSEGYSSILANIFIADQKKFISLLSQLEAAQISKVADYVAYGYGGATGSEQVKADLSTLIESGSLANAERDVAQEIFTAMENLPY